MRLQPRQELLEIWRATARTSYWDGKWVWGGGDGGNSIADAKQLLCIMLPATMLPRFRVDHPDATDADVLSSLRVLGDSVWAPRRLIRALAEYMDRYVDRDGNPIFPAGSHLSSFDPDRPLAAEQVDVDVVESFAVSITLTLSALSFAKTFRTQLTRPELIDETLRLEQLAGRRLTAAMIGLLRSYAVRVFDAEEPWGASLLRTVNQRALPRRQVQNDLRMALRETAAGLRDLTVGIQPVEVDDSNALFECGWSWGVVEGSPPIAFADTLVQPDGVAQPAPVLYFTVVALDGIAELFSDRTRLLGLLDAEQQRLAAALRLRWDLTRKYWATIAAFSGRRWPLEDIPWRGVDEMESDLFSLLVASITISDRAQTRGNDADLSRLGRVLGELASRARITRRPFVDDPALALHWPGVRLPLGGSGRDLPPMGYVVSEFAPLLLSQAIRVASLINNIDGRAEVLELVDDVWDHVVLRRSTAYGVYAHGSGLWDQPANAFSEITEPVSRPSWDHTLRVVESLVLAARLTHSQPLRSDGLVAFAHDLLAEAEHLFDQELLAGSAEAGKAMRERLASVNQRLRRAREAIADRPGSAVSLVLTALRDLDALAAARQTYGEM